MDDQKGSEILQSDKRKRSGSHLNQVSGSIAQEVRLFDGLLNAKREEQAQNNLQSLLFQHKRLDDPASQIRLLEILPGSIEDDIECTLRTYDLSTVPNYTAISYACGKASQQSPVLIDGKVLLVRKNCLRALRQARSYRVERCLLWIDAICIDQQNIQEKSAQVSFMGDIFEAADLVLACVGDEGDDSKFLFEEVFHLNDLRQLVREEYLWSWCSYCSGADYGTLTEQEFHLAHIWIAGMELERWIRLTDAFEAFCYRPYGRRLWIVQEVVLAREVYFLCGQEYLSFGYLSLLYKILDRVADIDVGNGIYTIALQHGLDYPDEEIQGNPMKIIFDTWNTKLNVYFALHQLAERECSDVRDRVYGILKLIDWPGGPPAPDYSKSNLEVAVEVLTRLGQELEFQFHTKAIVDMFALNDARARAEIIEMLCGHCYSTDEVRPYFDLSAQACQCKTPTRPVIAMTVPCQHYVRVSRGEDNDLYIKCVGDMKLDEHLRLELCIDEPHDTLTLSRPSQENSTIRYISDVCIEDGDILVDMEHPSDCSDFWILRQAKSGYHQIIGLAKRPEVCPVCPGGSFCTSLRGNSSCPKRDPFERSVSEYIWICLSAIDAITYRIFHCVGNQTRLLAKAPGLKGHFCRQLFSSFAIKDKNNGWALDGSFQTRHPQILSVPSIDGTGIPCVVCGGLFTPNENWIDTDKSK